MSDLRGMVPDLRGASSDLAGGHAAASAMVALFAQPADGARSAPRRAGWQTRLAGLLRSLAERLESEHGVPEPDWSGGTY